MKIVEKALIKIKSMEMLGTKTIRSIVIKFIHFYPPRKIISSIT